MFDVSIVRDISKCIRCESYTFVKVDCVEGEYCIWCDLCGRITLGHKDLIQSMLDWNSINTEEYKHQLDF